MGKIKARVIRVSPSEQRQKEREKVQKRVSLTARRGLLDLESLENIAGEYDAKTHGAARRYALRLVKLFRAGRLSPELAARGDWGRIGRLTKRFWYDENGQVVTEEMQAEETSKKTVKNQEMRRARAIFGEECGAMLLSGKACKNLKMLGASRCYRHGGKEQLEAKSAREGIEADGDPFAD
jgi:hypothetical protein